MNIFGNFIILQITAGLDPQGGRRNTIFRIIYAMLFGLFYLFTSIFITKNLRSNIDAALYDVSIINGNTAFVLTYIYLVIYRKQFYSLLEDMEDIVQQRIVKEEMSREIYEKAAKEINFVMRNISIGLYSIPTMYLSPYLLVLFHFCIRRYSIDSWFVYYPIWTPFEQNTAPRCAIVVLFEALVVTCILTVICLVTCLFLSSMIYVKACLLDIKSIYLQVTQLSKCENSESLMLECCKVAADLHERVNRFMEGLEDFTSMFIFLMVTPWAICICSSMFIIAKYTGNDFFADLQLPLTASIGALSSLFIFFFLGQKIHSNLMDLSDTIYQMEWHRYPRVVRCFILLMILRSQRPFYLSAFGILPLSLEVYVGLVKKIYSTFTLLRTME